MDRLPLSERQRIQEGRAINECFIVEPSCLVSEAYLNDPRYAHLRSCAINLINDLSPRDDVVVPYFALVYFDRYASSFTQERIPDLEHRVSLIAISCLSLAWELKSTDMSYSRQELLSLSGLEIEEDTLRMTEHEILIRLYCRMREVTALSFVKYLRSQIGFFDTCNRETVDKIIIEAQRDDIEFTRFKPSVVASSAILAAVPSVLRDMTKQNLLDCRKVKSLQDKAQVDACLAKMTAMCLNKKLLPVEEGEEDSDLPVQEAAAEASSSSGAAAGASSSLGTRRYDKGKQKLEVEPTERTAEENYFYHENLDLQSIIYNENYLSIDLSQFQQAGASQNDENGSDTSARPCITMIENYLSSDPSLFPQESDPQNDESGAGTSDQKGIFGENEGFSSVPSLLEQQQVAFQNDGNGAGTSAQKGIIDENEGLSSVPSLPQQQQQAAFRNDGIEGGTSAQKGITIENEGLSSVHSFQQHQEATAQNDENETNTDAQQILSNENEHFSDDPSPVVSSNENENTSSGPSQGQAEGRAAQDDDNEADARAQQRSKKCHNTCTLL